MKTIGLPILLVCLVAGPVVAEEPPPTGAPPANSELALDDSFDRNELGEGWRSTTGEWKIVDGVLRGSEIDAENHSAATRRVVETKNAVYELKFRFKGDCKAFHFGFDPARGELKKKPPHQNVWVKFGSGSFARLWYKASTRVSGVRNP